jgi:hypothetical protein
MSEGYSEREKEAVRDAQMADLLETLKHIARTTNDATARQAVLRTLRENFGEEYVRKEFGDAAVE